MRQRISALLAALVTLSLLSACAATPPSGAATPSATPSVAPANSAASQGAGVMNSFTTTDLQGNEVDPSIFADHDLTMVNIWATFCKPCIDEMPELGELHAEYAENGFQIIGLVADTLKQDGTLDTAQVDTAKDIVDQTGANYLHLLPSSDLFGILSQATSVPTTFFVDKNGAQVGHAYQGSRTKAQWTAIIDPLLAEVGE